MSPDDIKGMAIYADAVNLRLYQRGMSNPQPAKVDFL